LCAVDIAQLNILIQNCIQNVVFDNSTNNFMYCTLYYACAFGHCNIVDIIIQTKPNHNLPPAKYQISTALAAAAAGGYMSVVELLIQQKADVNAMQFERAALQAAALEDTSTLLNY
jgi:ankyrin repeat protein